MARPITLHGLLKIISLHFSIVLSVPMKFSPGGASPPAWLFQNPRWPPKYLRMQAGLLDIGPLQQNISVTIPARKKVLTDHLYTYCGKNGHVIHLSLNISKLLLMSALLYSDKQSPNTKINDIKWIFRIKLGFRPSTFRLQRVRL